MTKYYYLGTALPELSMDAPSDISTHELKDLLRDNLSEQDYRKIQVVRTLYDILNLKALWLGGELDPWGNLDANELEEALAGQVGFPSYVYDFLETYEKKVDRLSYFPALLVEFFHRAAASQPDGFLKDYLHFEREWRLVFAGFRAKKIGRDLSVELQYEDPRDELIAQLLAQKEAKSYEPPEKYSELKLIFDRYAENPIELQKAIDQYRFHFIKNLASERAPFSFDQILAYVLQFIIVNKWFALDQEKGIKIVDTIVKEIT